MWLMNFRLVWQALMFTVVVGGVLFTLGIIVQRPGITDAAFNPFVGFASFLAGLVVLRRRTA
jgi:hypothetical protein